MKSISEVISFLFAAVLTIWIADMLLAGSPCERVYKSSNPWTISVGFVERVGQNWLEPGTRISLLQLKADGAVFIQKSFAKTVYGSDLKCKF